MKCIYCNHHKLYNLKNGHKKCAACKRKFSTKKLERDFRVLRLYSEGKNALLVSKSLKINYLTVKNLYTLFRKLSAKFLEESYDGRRVVEYDEYIYLPKSKKPNSKNIFESYDFLTFHYENKIYNILMPDISRYKESFLENKAQEPYYKEFSKFMMFNKITKIQKRDNLITKFWLFFEEEITKYRGFKHENFFYYLKEIEFNFNYEPKERYEILKNLHLSVFRV